MKKLNKLWLAVAAIFARPVNMANEDEAANADAKFQPPMSSGGFDFRKMVYNLLGIPEEAENTMVSTAYASAMKYDCEGNMSGLNSKDLETVQGELLAANTKIEETTASLEAANAAKAESDLKVKTIEAMLNTANEKATKAEADVANSRQSLRKFIGAALVKEGRLSKAQWETENARLSGAEFANSEQFDAHVAKLAANTSSYGVTSSIFGMLEGLGEMNKNKGNAQTAKDEIAKMVANAQAENPKLTYDEAWANVKGSEKGKGLLAQMKQPSQQAV